MPLISINKVSKKYGNNEVLYDLNFTVDKGELISIIGPFGSGKTTLLKLLGGIMDDFSGEILIDGKIPDEVRKQKKIGFSFQKPTLLPWMNVLNNITLPTEIVGNRKTKDALNLLKLVGLESISKKKTFELSGGMQQLVSILRSLILNPDVLLLDEPFSSVDQVNRDSFNDKLLKIHKETNKTTIVITHSLEDAVYLSDRVVALSPPPGTVKRIIPINLPQRNTDVKTTSQFQHFTKILKKELEHNADY